MTGQVIYLTSDLVGVHWLRSLTIFPTDTDISNYLPSVDETNDLLRWSGRDFITCVTVGGNVDLYSPEYAPVYQIDCWSKPAAASGRPPWNRANQLAEGIRHVQYVMGSPAVITLPSPYPAVRVVDVTVRSEPRRVVGDPLGLARYTLDVALTFIPE